MSAVLTSPMPVARPKIHRLPASYASQPKKRASASAAMPKLIAYAPYIAGGTLVLALLAAIPPQPSETQNYVKSEKVREAALVPQISVTPQDESLALLPEEPKTTTFAMNNARTAAPLAAVTPASTPVQDQLTDDSRGKTIILQGKNEAIIGQMARIPLENEPITEIKSASEVDNSAGRELLSIINKY